MEFRMNKQIARRIAALGLVGASAASQAAAVDVTALTADIALQVAPVVAVGGAVLLVVVAAKAFKWVRSALS
jgi:hypothetical protein